MNIYLVSLIALIVAFVVGYVVYGQVFKTALKDATPAPSASHIALSAIGLYLAMLAFGYLYTHLYLGDTTSVMRGLTLGALVGIGCFALPLYTDSPFFKTGNSNVMAVLVNWVASFLAVGIVFGLLIS